MRPGLRKLVRMVFLVLLLGFIAIQFARPDFTNPSTAQGATLEAQLAPPPEVSRLLAVACNDCHSHDTRWPWYSQLAPVSWLVAKDVRDGRKHLNLSRLSEQPESDRAKLLREASEEVSDGEMPLRIYLLTHPDARLSVEDRNTLATWLASAADNLDGTRGRGRHRDGERR